MTANLEQARKLAASQAWTPQRVLAEIEGVDLFDRKLRESLRSERDTVVPGLLELLSAQPPMAQLKASVLLLHLREARGTAGFVALLSSSDPDVRVSTLAQLSVLPLTASLFEPNPLPIDRDALVGALTPIALADPDGHEGGIALDILLSLTPMSHQHPLLALLTNDSPNVRRKICAWLGDAGVDLGALDSIEEMVNDNQRSHHDRHRPIQIAVDEDVSDSQDSEDLDPWEATRLHWLASDITPTDVARRLAPMGIEADEAFCADLDAAWEDDPSPFSVIAALLGEARLLAFDCEAGVVPVDHAELVRDFAKLADGVIHVESVSQLGNEDPCSTPEEPYRLCFVVNETVVRFEARDLGDWYDVSAVTHALNSTLERFDHSARYVVLPTGDQTVCVIFVNDAMFREAAADLRLPIDDDPSDARQHRVTFEA